MLQIRMFTKLWAVQERAKELAAHEEQLEEWKKRFKAEALRQIGERERALADWQAQLDAKRADLEDLKKNMEARPSFPVRFLISAHIFYAPILQVSGRQQICRCSVFLCREKHAWYCGGVLTHQVSQAGSLAYGAEV